ncbi:Hypothetical_protein [Hexamita inflata]|uniref:Hypothetical_protein n=1 Tax=Hexamita inflata TaxID=28002 RepID=A0AA86QRP3_9EUKA|nr:Hypothetical protein HINF_LOCUS47891 [Hexamita inflata]
MILLFNQALSSLCDGVDCSGFGCKVVIVNQVEQAVCDCDQSKFSADCSMCRNFRFSVSSKCTECIESYLDVNKACAACVNGPNLDLQQECKQCIDSKYDIKQNCNACKRKHMDFASQCTTCEGEYKLMVNECITSTLKQFTIYFGLIFAHLLIGMILVLAFLQNKKKKAQKAEPLISE